MISERLEIDDGYVVWKNDRRSFTVYEKHPSGDLVRVGRCESRGGAKRLIRKHKAQSAASLLASTHVSARDDSR